MDNLPDRFQSFEAPTELTRLAVEDPVLAEAISRYSIHSAIDWYGQGYGGVLMSHDFEKAKEWVQKDQRELAWSVLNAKPPERREEAVRHICLLAVNYTYPEFAKAIDTVARSMTQIKAEHRARKQSRMLESLKTSVSEQTAGLIETAFPETQPDDSSLLHGILAEAVIRDPAYAQTLIEESRSIAQLSERSGFAQRFGLRNSSPPHR